MGRKARKAVKISKPAQAPQPHFEVTPERLAQAGNDNASTVHGAIDKAGERALLCRKFTDSHLDRLFRSKRLTYAQWYAGDWYRQIYELAGIEQRQTANYEPSVSSGGRPSYGMPTTVGQAISRQNLRKGREQIGQQMLGIVDALVLHEQMPAFRNGQERNRYGHRIGKALQPLADWLGVNEHAA